MIEPRQPMSSAAVAHHYDELDQLYREVWGEHLHHGLWRSGRETVQDATLQLLAEVAQHARIAPGAQVCDVGCGYGATARWLATQCGAQVTGLTLSAAQHAYAEAQMFPVDAPMPRYLLQDWLTNEMPAQSFDAVLAIESTAHITDKQRGFAEAQRVLRPGGRFVVCAWLTSATPSPWAVRHLLEPICREGRLAGMGSATQYRRMLEAAGFVVEHYEDVSDQVRRTWAVCVARVMRGLLSEPTYRRYLLDPQGRERVFAWTVGRIWAAYWVEAMRYGVFVARR